MVRGLQSRFGNHPMLCRSPALSQSILLASPTCPGLRAVGRFFILPLHLLPCSCLKRSRNMRLGSPDKAKFACCQIVPSPVSGPHSCALTKKKPPCGRRVAFGYTISLADCSVLFKDNLGGNENTTSHCALDLEILAAHRRSVNIAEQGVC